MRFERLDEDGCWQASPTTTGPAGSVGLAIDPVLIEFDRLGHGRIVRMVVFDDAPDPTGLLGDLRDRLESAGGETVTVETADTPLAALRLDLADLAVLDEDCAAFAGNPRADLTAVGLATAERADVLHRLGGVAPDSPTDALARAGRLLRSAVPDGRPQVAWPAIEPVRALATRIAAWAPSGLDATVRALSRPVERPSAPTRPRPERTTLGGAPVATASPPRTDVPVPEDGTITWDGEVGTFAIWPAEGRGTVRRDGPAVEMAVAVRDDEPRWAYLFDGPRMVAAGPLDRHGGWFGPLDRAPTSAAVVRHPYRAPGRTPTDHVRSALAAARTALAAEAVGADASSHWSRCGEEWLGAGELGRGAVALDRSDGPRADLARAVAPAWARPYLGGHGGRPHHPVWRAGVPGVPAPDLGGHR